MQEITHAGPLLRQVNSQSLLQLIIHAGPVTRVELARRSALSKQTVSEIVRELERAGWVRETGRVHGRVGRSPVAYEFNPRSGFVIGVDLGGTKLRAGIADLGGEVLHELVEPTDVRGGRHVIEQITALSRRLAALTEASWDAVRCVGIGSPGVPNPQTGVMDFAANIPVFGDLHVGEDLNALLGVPVLLDNDVNMAVLGEHWQGLGQDSSDFVFVAIGTGVGMGLVVDDEIRRGARGAAGEICYLPLGADAFDPANQVKGAFEEAAAGAGLVRRYVEAGGAKLGVPELFDAAANGDALAQQVLDDEGRLIAQAVCAVASVLDPELVVLGGGIGSRPELLDPVRTWLGRLMLQPPEVHTSILGHRASLIGALALALRAAHRDLLGATSPVAPLVLPIPSNDITIASPTVANTVANTESGSTS
ncbi:ROK family transcriptional regulator [Streptosporangium sp. NPDC051023]|uniref:ROK family transcriptional regulator n=1 Tax=Streptosporangium sp. NPDC051023 TaxID=3155410 RepID=UPI00344FB400